MKHCIIALSALLLAQPAIAQEYPGDFWTNPATGRTELLNLGSGVLPAVPQPTDRPAIASNVRIPAGYEPIAELQGGEVLSVDPSSRRDRSNGQVSFRARTNSPTGQQPYARSYRVDCQNFDLMDVTASDGANGRVAIAPGSAAEALYRWACS